MEEMTRNISVKDSLSFLGIKAVNEIQSSSNKLSALEVLLTTLGQRKAYDKARHFGEHLINRDVFVIIVRNKRPCFWKQEAI